MNFTKLAKKTEPPKFPHNSFSNLDETMPLNQVFLPLLRKYSCREISKLFEDKTPLFLFETGGQWLSDFVFEFTFLRRKFFELHEINSTEFNLKSASKVESIFREIKEIVSGLRIIRSFDVLSLAGSQKSSWVQPESDEAALIFDLRKVFLKLQLIQQDCSIEILNTLP